MSRPILIEPHRPGIVSVILNRPQRRNALNIELLEQLCEKIEELEQDRSNRVVLLRGAGSVFSAGLDLSEAADHLLVPRSAKAVQQALAKLRETSLIVIAVVQGGAFAGGAGLAAACDLVVASSTAKFGFPEARRGLLPALICDVLRHKIREGDLRDLFLAGEPIDAARAQQIGLVQRIAEEDELLSYALQTAAAVAAGAPDTIRHTKLLLNNAFAVSDTSDSLIESHLAARHSEEAREGLAAFLEKREPKWK